MRYVQVLAYMIEYTSTDVPKVLAILLFSFVPVDFLMKNLKIPETGKDIGV